MPPAARVSREHRERRERESGYWLSKTFGETVVRKRVAIPSDQ